MKKWILFLAILVVIGQMVACSSLEDNAPPTQQQGSYNPTTAKQ